MESIKLRMRQKKKQTEKILGGRMDKVSYRIDIQRSLKQSEKKDFNQQIYLETFTSI